MTNDEYLAEVDLMEEVLQAFQAMLGIIEGTASPEEDATLHALEWLRTTNLPMCKVVGIVVDELDSRLSDRERTVKAVEGLLRGVHFLRFVRMDPQPDPWVLLRLGALHGTPHLPPIPHPDVFEEIE